MEKLFYQTIGSSLHDVLVTMAGMDNLKTEPPYLKSPDEPPRGDISVIIGFSGPAVRGTFVLHFTKQMAYFLLDKLFGLPANQINDEVLDGLGEVTNIVVGKIKTDVMAKGVEEFNITVPTIIIGKGFQTHIKMDEPAMLFPFVGETAEQCLLIELKVKKCLPLTLTQQGGAHA